MTQKEFRSTVRAKLNAHPWFTARNIRAHYLDGSTTNTELIEADLRDATRRAVLCVTHVIGGKVESTALRGQKVKRRCEIGVIVRVNPQATGAPDPDDMCDEVIKAVSGSNATPSNPGQEPIAYTRQALVTDSVVAHQIFFDASLIT